LSIGHATESAPDADATAPLATPAATTSGRPVYALIDNAPEPGAVSTSAYRVHVVHNGDTLERLAERYLADRGRSLELFDLNRDVLENPHVLPIGAELRIPAPASNAGD
jgi:nucleoid-associated protein YgaU